jgi:hypothetical protein
VIPQTPLLWREGRKDEIMTFPDAMIRVIGEHECPYYTVGDEFPVYGNAVKSPTDKMICLILTGDIVNVLSVFEKVDRARNLFYCSGCEGTIKLAFEKEPTEAKSKPSEPVAGHTTLLKLLGDFPLFQRIDRQHVKNLLSSFHSRKYKPGETIIEKGDVETPLYLIAGGKVEIVDDGVVLAVLEKGEVFGEMSLLSGDPVGATVRVLEPTTVLFMEPRFFRKLLTRFPSIQMYLSKLLAKRLAKTNIIMSSAYASAMIGNLSDLPPAELLQTMNINNKTGVLNMNLTGGPARIAFRDGEIIRSQYRKSTGREAVFEILKETSGRFTFVPGIPPEDESEPKIGSFMGILMEGMKKVDEAGARNKTSSERKPS